MTISYRGEGSNVGFTNSLIVTMSATAQDGDHLIATACFDGLSATFTWPSGFTERGYLSGGTDHQTVAWADKVAGASEPSTYTIGVGSTKDFVVSVTARSGVDTTTPRDVTPTAQILTSGASPWNVTGLGLASGTANRWLVWIGAVDNIGSGTVTSAVPSASPDTWTERIDASNGFWVNTAVCDCLDAAGTYTSDVTGVQTLGVVNGDPFAFLIALRPFAGGSSATTAWLRA